MQLTLINIILFVTFIFIEISGHETNVLSALRKKVFRGYQKDVKPDGQVVIRAGMSIIDLNLDPKTKVSIH